MVGREMYIWTTWEPVMVPMFLTVRESVRMNSPPETITVPICKLLRVNLVYDKPCLPKKERKKDEKKNHFFDNMVFFLPESK